METLYFILISIFSLISLIAMLIFIRGLFPIRVEKIQTTLNDHWKRSFWLGLVNTIFITIFVIGLSMLASNNQLFLIPAFFVYGAILIGLLFGFSGFLQILGQRLFSEQNHIKRDIQAGIVFVLTGVFPVVGWFLFFPYVICLAVGSVFLTIFKKRGSTKQNESKKK